MATIHINPENKGKFTETKRRTGKTTEELTHSKNPLTRKRAIFAQNAKKFKHEFGGPLNEESLLGNKIINVPAEYVFNSYLDQPKQYGFGSWMDAPVNADGTSGGLSANGMLVTQGAQVVGQGIQDISDAYRPEKVNWGSNIGGGALKGAAAGAAMGTVVPVLGNGVGAVVGGAVGAIGGGIKSVVKAQELKREKENALIDQENMLKKVATNRLMSYGGPLNFNSNVGSQLLSPVAGSITKDLTQSEYDELDQKKVLSDLSRGKVEFANGGKIDMWYGSDDYLDANHLMDKYPNGGSIEESMKYHDAQPLYTEAFANKYPNIPVKDILKRSVDNPVFHNTRLDQVSDSLRNKYGDASLNKHEMDSLVKKGYPNIVDINNNLNEADKKAAGYGINTKGNKEESPESFGYRMMMQRAYPKGSNPYKYLEQKANGGSVELASNWIVPTYGQGGNFDFMMANGGHPIQPNVQDVDGSNMDVPSTNNNIYTKGGSSFTKRRGGTEQPSEDFTAYNSGQTHEQSPIGGIPVGGKALTETGEVRYNSKKHGAYIFSNKF